MASKIRIHRSTGASAPSSLEFGELAATVEQATAGNSANKAGRLFIGNVAGNPVEIGGEYTYKLLDHTPGELHLSSALITDANANINGLRIAGIATITRTDITDAVTQNLRVTGVGTFVAGLDLNGNVTIGNQHTDILTINSRTGVSTDMTLNNGLKVVGLSTFSNAVDVNATTAFGDDVTFETANTNNIVFDKSANDLTFGDDVIANFGTGKDLKIFQILCLMLSIKLIYHKFSLKVILLALKVKVFFKSLKIVAYSNTDYKKKIYHIVPLYRVLLKKVLQEKVTQTKT